MLSPLGGYSTGGAIGCVHGAEDWEEPVLPEIEQQGQEVVFRADAATLPSPSHNLRGAGGARRGVRHPYPLQGQPEREITELLTRPVGRSIYKPVVWYKIINVEETT